LMNENNKSFYPSDMFEFIHHPEYGCRGLKGLKVSFITSSKQATHRLQQQLLGE
jgi:hypothetical protein